MYNVGLGAGVLSTAMSVAGAPASAGGAAAEVEAAVVSSVGGACVMTTSIV